MACSKQCTCREGGRGQCLYRQPRFPTGSFRINLNIALRDRCSITQLTAARSSNENAQSRLEIHACQVGYLGLRLRSLVAMGMKEPSKNLGDFCLETYAVSANIDGTDLKPLSHARKVWRQARTVKAANSSLGGLVICN